MPAHEVGVLDGRTRDVASGVSIAELSHENLVRPAVEGSVVYGNHQNVVEFGEADHFAANHRAGLEVERSCGESAEVSGDAVGIGRRNRSQVDERQGDSPCDSREKAQAVVGPSQRGPKNVVVGNNTAKRPPQRCFVKFATYSVSDCQMLGRAVGCELFEAPETVLSGRRRDGFVAGSDLDRWQSPLGDQSLPH